MPNITDLTNQFRETQPDIHSVENFANALRTHLNDNWESYNTPEVQSALDVLGNTRGNPNLEDQGVRNVAQSSRSSLDALISQLKASNSPRQLAENARRAAGPTPNEIAEQHNEQLRAQRSGGAGTGRTVTLPDGTVLTGQDAMNYGRGNQPVAQPPGRQPQAGQAQQSQVGQPQTNQVAGATTNATPLPVSTYQGGSVQDYLTSIGQAGDYASRAIIAKQQGIQNYTGTAAQNTQMLQTLRARQGTVGGGAPSLVQSAVSGMQSPPSTSQGSVEVVPTLTGNPQLDALFEQLKDTSPQKSWSQIYKQTYKDLGIDSMNRSYEDQVKKQTELQNKKNDEIQDINNNPWFSEGVRVQKLNQLDKKYEGKELILQNQIKLLENNISEAREEAQFITGQTMTQLNKAAELNQNMILKAIDLVESSLEAEAKLAEKTDVWSEPYNLGGDLVQKNKQSGEIRTAVNVPKRTSGVGANTTYGVEFTPTETKNYEAFKSEISSYKSKKEAADDLVANKATIITKIGQRGYDLLLKDINSHFGIGNKGTSVNGKFYADLGNADSAFPSTPSLETEITNFLFN